MMDGRGKDGAQTLDRGLRLLEELADGPLSAAELAARLGLHRTIVYRLLRTLINRGFVQRDAEGRHRLSVRMVELCRGVERNLQEVAMPRLSWLAAEVAATAVLTVADGDEAVCLAAVEPPHSGLHIAYRPGRRHRLDTAASGVAILAGRPPTPDEPPRVSKARERGYAVSQGELQSSAVGVAAPIVPRGRLVEASVAVVSVPDHLELDTAARAVRGAAEQIAAALA